MKRNCWEVMRCGRQPGGENAGKQGVCPAAKAGEYDGINHGAHNGRFCWVVAGTLCGGHTHGSFASKFLTCLDCKFLIQVMEEEGRDFVISPVKLRKNQTQSHD